MRLLSSGQPVETVAQFTEMILIIMPEESCLLTERLTVIALPCLLHLHEHLAFSEHMAVLWQYASRAVEEDWRDAAAEPVRKIKSTTVETAYTAVGRARALRKKRYAVAARHEVADGAAAGCRCPLTRDNIPHDV